MNTEEILVSQFKLDIFNYMLMLGRINIEIEEEFDEDGVHFIFHNDRALDRNEAFRLHVSQKKFQYLIPNGLDNICFTYDYRLAKKVGPASGIQEMLKTPLLFDKFSEPINLTPI